MRQALPPSRAIVPLLMFSLAGAPFQCASSPEDNASRIEDSAPEALWQLAMHFDERGERQARDETLERLRDWYPRSRFASRAERTLRERRTGKTESPAEQLNTADGSGESPSLHERLAADAQDDGSRNDEPRDDDSRDDDSSVAGSEAR